MLERTFNLLMKCRGLNDRCLPLECDVAAAAEFSTAAEALAEALDGAGRPCEVSLAVARPEEEGQEFQCGLEQTAAGDELVHIEDDPPAGGSTDCSVLLDESQVRQGWTPSATVGVLCAFIDSVPGLEARLAAFLGRVERSENERHQQTGG